MSQLIVIHTSATPGHLLSRKSEGRAHQGGGGRGVADSHITDDQQVGAGRDLHLAIASPARSAARQSAADRASAWSIGWEGQVMPKPRPVPPQIIIDTEIEYPQRHVLPSKAVSASDAGDEHAPSGVTSRG